MIHIRKVEPHELEIALELLQEAALWLKSRNIDYWQNWINPACEYIAWIEQGFNRNEFHFVESYPYDTVSCIYSF